MKYKLKKKIVLEFEKGSQYELDDLGNVTVVTSKKPPHGMFDPRFIHTQTLTQIVHDFISKGLTEKIEANKK